MWQGKTPGEWAVLLRPANTGPGSTAPQSVLVVARFALVQAPMLLAAAAGVAGFEFAWIVLAALAFVQAGLVWKAKDWNGSAELRLGIILKDDR
jgi:tryptophan-rich sensory protein